ncbi:mpv17-like protein 2 [Diorhabda sublineata]|uniref:mpv17-like protein 2 n=1 Tax=Diorhabda sublineata TaxID=1163346 RepID=UPI0024E1254C|nr:mpv17-like protein 2 [Diorhabda sublineata]
MNVNKLLSKAFSSKYLLMTNISLSISLSAVGDLLEQKYEILTEDLDELNLRRTKNLAITGLPIGLVCHFWYKYLDKFLPGYTLRVVTKKVIADQCIASPLCIATFFLSMQYLEGKSKSEFIEEAKEKSVKLYAADWMIWPPAQFINFYLLPYQYRILFDNMVSLGFDVYTSRVKHLTKEKVKSCHG